jgi:hypothetical protein
MTLLVRDEADIIDAHLSFHLNAGVDFVVATDHRSVDGSIDVLESYARDGYVRLIREDRDQIRQSEWVTRMARMAAADHGADWVINSDADEFWWPRATSLTEALAAVPSRYGVVYAPMCYFLPTQRTGSFYDVMIARLVQAAPINNPLSRYRPTMNAVHRAGPAVVVLRGNHEVRHAGRSLHSWHPFEVLHFPDRSATQFARKYANRVAAYRGGPRSPGAFVSAAQGSIERAGVEESFDRLTVADGDLAPTAPVRAFEIDTRLRDALRRLRSPTGGFMRPGELKRAFAVPSPNALDETRHSVDVAVAREAQLVRLQRRVDDLGLRIGARERAVGARRLRRLARRR